MKHLRLGCNAFIIDTRELSLTIGEDNYFSRDELPENLKPLFDIVKEEKSNDKPVYFFH